MTPEQIKTLRKTLKLNTAQFGALLCKSGRTIENYEQGRRQPDKLTEKVITKLTVDTLIMQSNGKLNQFIKTLRGTE